MFDFTPKQEMQEETKEERDKDSEEDKKEEREEEKDEVVFTSKEVESIITAVTGPNQDKEDGKRSKLSEAQRKKRKLNWKQTIDLERRQSFLVEETFRKQRTRRLQKLFTADYSDEDDDFERIMQERDARRSVRNIVDKIDIHLHVEKKILEAWKYKDEQNIYANEVK